MAVPRPGYVWSGTEWVPIGVAPEGSAVTNHEQLTGRSQPAQHPTSAVDGLDEALAGKALSGHTHAGDTVAGAGIAVAEVGTTVTITNTDLGSQATAGHVGQTDPHAGKYAAPTHSHDYADPEHSHPYSPDSHGHGTIYDPAGEAASRIDTHEATEDPHGAYLTPAEVYGGPGIAATPDGMGGVVLTNTAQNVGVAGIGAGQVTPRNIPDQTWQGMQLDKPILGTIEHTSGTTVATAGFTLGAGAPEGWYQATAAVSIIPNATGRRMARVTVNGDPLGAPLIPTAGVPTALSGSNAYLFTGGPVYLRPGDRVSVEGWQNSGIQLQSAIDNTVLSVVFTGEAA